MNHRPRLPELLGADLRLVGGPESAKLIAGRILEPEGRSPSSQFGPRPQAAVELVVVVVGGGGGGQLLAEKFNESDERQ